MGSSQLKPGTTKSILSTPAPEVRFHFHPDCHSHLTAEAELGARIPDRRVLAHAADGHHSLAGHRTHRTVAEDTGLGLVVEEHKPRSPLLPLVAAARMLVCSEVDRDTKAWTG